MMRKKWKIYVSAAAAVLAVWYLVCLPRDLFKDTDYSTVVLSKDGGLLGARIADDGQWRFPPCKTVPEKYGTCLVEFEDRYFRYHPGVNPVSVLRAAAGNIRAGHVTSGGSTITMQVIRLSRGRERNFRQKMIEAVLATRLELRCSKKTILAMYASHAPFGGNVVGVDAAAWRYFGRPADELSWGEAATLAVLPNAPGAVHMGRGREELLRKRNRLLKRLMENGRISMEEYSLAVTEPLPQAPHPLPALAPHLTEYWASVSHGQTIHTDIDYGIQKRVAALADSWSDKLSETGISDLAAVVIDVRSGAVAAYVGNASQYRTRPGMHVDIARASRSTGSVLKPLLYCALLQEGEILPKTLVPDLPVNLGGFSPQNYDMQFSGAVPADEALARSLNVPSVHMLRRFGVPKFYNLLKELGMGTLDRDAEDYGLSLVLGGAEGALLDLTSIYARLSQVYQSEDTKGSALHDRTALWYMFDALKEVNRPDEIDWRTIRSIRKTAWKTGTSFGFRDAWAIGVTPEYAVGVWAGNADGHGVPGLTGARTAGPLMFEIFNTLPRDYVSDAYAEDGWFLEPVYGEYVTAEVCHESGFLKGINCPDADTLKLPRAAMRTVACPYHRVIDGESRFVLPPAMEWYYRKNHPEYKVPPAGSGPAMEFIYPENGAEIRQPRLPDGSKSPVVFSLAHRNSGATVFWHLDNSYLGSTHFIHQIALDMEPGKHVMTVTDENGDSANVTFEIL